MKRFVLPLLVIASGYSLNGCSSSSSTPISNPEPAEQPIEQPIQSARPKKLQREPRSPVQAPTTENPTTPTTTRPDTTTTTTTTTTRPDEGGGGYNNPCQTSSCEKSPGASALDPLKSGSIPDKLTNQDPTGVANQVEAGAKKAAKKLDPRRW